MPALTKFRDEATLLKGVINEIKAAGRTGEAEFRVILSGGEAVKIALPESAAPFLVRSVDADMCVANPDIENLALALGATLSQDYMLDKILSRHNVERLQNSPFKTHHVSNIPKVDFFVGTQGPVPLKDSEFENAAVVEFEGVKIRVASTPLVVATHINPCAITPERLKKVALYLSQYAKENGIETYKSEAVAPAIALLSQGEQLISEAKSKVRFVEGPMKERFSHLYTSPIYTDYSGYLGRIVPLMIDNSMRKLSNIARKAGICETEDAERALLLLRDGLKEGTRQ